MLIKDCSLSPTLVHVPDHEPQTLEIPRPEVAIGQAPASEIVKAEIAESARAARPRRVILPLVLFLLTCVSTFYAGATQWMPFEYFNAGWHATAYPDPYFQAPARRVILEHWQSGLIYMSCVLAILLTHEMGHFVMTVIYR